MGEEKGVRANGVDFIIEGQNLSTRYANNLEGMAEILIQFREMCRDDFVYIYQIVELLIKRSEEASYQIEGDVLSHSDKVQLCLEHINNNGGLNAQALLTALERKEDLMQKINDFQIRCNDFCLGGDEYGFDVSLLLGQSTNEVMTIDLSGDCLFADSYSSGYGES